MNLDQLLDRIHNGSVLSGQISAWHSLPAVSPRYGGFPPWIDPRLRTAFGRRGVSDLYLHQRQAADLAHARRSVVVVTPTASGKTLCYNLPILQRIIEDPSRRALYLFPTKALAQDQLAGLQELLDEMDVGLKVHTYDGDTPSSARSAIRAAAHIVVTNPDMLHSGILPHHTKWLRLFENLDYVVIDELHQYRGVFGSHLANVLRRLDRVCSFYGSHPTYILCSATIANPGELAASLTGREANICLENGAPMSPRQVILYNPPVINARLGIRRSSLIEASSLATELLSNNIPTIVFARSRLNVEVILTYLQRSLGKNKDCVRGYRGGYLPRERRAIERGLRSGDILGVVGTNALELGVDIGGLQAAVLAGYPGTVASFWQQVGRAGRRADTAAAFLVASSSPLDQYLINHPEYLLGLSPESGLVNPDNLQILSSHVKCAAFELPFDAGDLFGTTPVTDMCDYLSVHGVLRPAAGRYYWMAESFPAEDVSLRSAATTNVVIIERSSGLERVIGEVDRFSAPMLVHEQAVYIHNGVQYQVEQLDLELNRAFVRRDNVDYYTDVTLAVNLAVLSVDDSTDHKRCRANRGEVAVTALASIFKKIKLHSHENVGWGKIHLPEEQMHTHACWWEFVEPQGLSQDALQGALAGVAAAAANVAPLLLMADPRDIHSVAQVKSPFSGMPAVYVYDAYPGGIGLSERLFRMTEQLWPMARDLVRECPCADGCPSCILGRSGGVDKAAALGILDTLCGEAETDDGCPADA